MSEVKRVRVYGRTAVDLERVIGYEIATGSDTHGRAILAGGQYVHIGVAEWEQFKAEWEGRPWPPQAEPVPEMVQEPIAEKTETKAEKKKREQEEKKLV